MLLLCSLLEMFANSFRKGPQHAIGQILAYHTEVKGTYIRLQNLKLSPDSTYNSDGDRYAPSSDLHLLFIG